MNRFLTTLIIVITLVGAAAIGAFLLFHSTPSTTPAPVVQTTPSVTNNSTVSVPSSDADKQAVQAAYKAELAKHQSDNTKLYETVIAGGYALQVYAGDIMGGEALLKYDPGQGHWILVDGGGGAWSIASLVMEGVPTSTAETLLAGVSR